MLPGGEKCLLLQRTHPPHQTSILLFPIEIMNTNNLLGLKENWALIKVLNFQTKELGGFEPGRNQSIPAIQSWFYSFVNLHACASASISSSVPETQLCNNWMSLPVHSALSLSLGIATRLQPRARGVVWKGQTAMNTTQEKPQLESATQPWKLPRSGC